MPRTTTQIDRPSDRRVEGVNDLCARILPETGERCERKAEMVVFGDDLDAGTRGLRCYGCAARQLGHDIASGRGGQGKEVFRLVAEDITMGRYVYCHSHVRPHPTGWCTVGPDNKVALHALTAEEALAETRELGLPIYGEENV